MFGVKVGGIDGGLGGLDLLSSAGVNLSVQVELDRVGGQTTPQFLLALVEGQLALGIRPADPPQAAIRLRDVPAVDALDSQGMLVNGPGAG